MEAVSLHDACSAFALAPSDDVHALSRREELSGDLLAERVLAGVVRAQLDDVASRGHPGLLEVTGVGLVDLAGVDRAEGELDGRVAVVLRGANLGHHAR